MPRTRAHLFGPTLLTGSAATLFTATYITDVEAHCANNNNAAIAMTLSIGADAAGTRIMPAVSIAANSYVDIRFTLNAGEILQGFGGTTNKITVDGAGYTYPPG